MAELVDALASGASVRMDVEVRVLFWAPNQSEIDYTFQLLGWLAKILAHAAAHLLISLMNQLE